MIKMKDLVDLSGVLVDVFAACSKCKKYHNYSVHPKNILRCMTEWNSKHKVEHDCETHFITTKRKIPAKFDDSLYEKMGRAPWWLEKLGYKHNTDFKVAYVASAAVTNAVQSLGTSTTLLAGYESDVIDNTSNLYIDYFLSGKNTVGTSPTATTRIELHSVSLTDDSEWPDVFDGATGAETINSQGIKDSICVPLVYLNCDATTSDRVYHYTQRSLASIYGGICPTKSIIFTTHNTGVNLNSTAGNHELNKTGVYLTGA